MNEKAEEVLRLARDTAGNDGFDLRTREDIVYGMVRGSIPAETYTPELEQVWRDLTVAVQDEFTHTIEELKNEREG